MFRYTYWQTFERNWTMVRFVDQHQVEDGKLHNIFDGMTDRRDGTECL